MPGVEQACTLVLQAYGHADELSSPDRDTLSQWRSSYNESVSELAGHFDRDSDWWFVPLSSRDHFASALQESFQLAASVDTAMATTSGPLKVVCEDGVLAAALADLAALRGWRVHRRLGDRLMWMGRNMRRRIVNLMRLGAQLVRVWRGWGAGWRYGSWATRTAGLDIVFVAPIHLPVPLNQAEIFCDTYFGALPQTCADRGSRTAVTGPALCDPIAHARAARDIDRIPIVPLESMVTAADALAICFQAVMKWINPPTLPRRLAAKLPRMHAFVHREIADAIALRIQGAQFERAFGQLLVRSPNVRVIHTYENNWWEHAINRVCNEQAGRPPTIGYLHCAVIESHLKNYRRKDEVNRPEPDRIVCTGPAARDVLLSLGEYEPDKVADGFAFRAPDLSSLARREGSIGTVKTILVLLEGLYTMAGFLRMLDKAGPAFEGRRVIVRAHPVLPLEKLAAIARIPLAPKGHLEPSSGVPLLEDIARADLVMFKASSTALTAGYIGVPLVRYRDEWWLSDDPLRECDALKIEVRGSEEVSAAIAHFENMPTTQLNAERARLRSYVDRYFRVPTEEIVSAFGLDPGSQKEVVS